LQKNKLQEKYVKLLYIIQLKIKRKCPYVVDNKQLRNTRIRGNKEAHKIAFFLPKKTKKLEKTVDRKCLRCYNIQVSQVSYAHLEVHKMQLEELRQAEKRSVGVKQAEKAVAKAKALKVFVASDADSRVTANLVEQCKINQVELVIVENMHELGRACGIHVKAAAAVILKI